MNKTPTKALPSHDAAQAETRPFRVEFSVFGADATPKWRRAIVSSAVVHARDADHARELAGFGDATRSVTPA